MQSMQRAVAGSCSLQMLHRTGFDELFLTACISSMLLMTKFVGNSSTPFILNNKTIHEEVICEVCIIHI